MNKQELKARKERTEFLKGREYERTSTHKTNVRASVMAIFRDVIKKFPKYRKPDDGYGDEDAINRGYNEAIDDISKLILDEVTNVGKKL